MVSSAFSSHNVGDPAPLSGVRSVHSVFFFPPAQASSVVLISTNSEIPLVGVGTLGYCPHRRLGVLASVNILSGLLSQILPLATTSGTTVDPELLCKGQSHLTFIVEPGN